MAQSNSSRFAWWSAITIFLGAFLLFQVQPIISKMILPWFGGGPAVWTTCMLFFQVLLLGGYAYCHFLMTTSNLKLQTWLHVGLLVLAACTLPITPDTSWKPQDGTQPTLRILTLLLANVGLPYFILSSTGPLVQAWFARVYPFTSPYRLYSLSNVGSLGALLTFPFLVEPQLTTTAQGFVWSIGFGLYAILCTGLAIVAGRHLTSTTALSNDPKEGSTEDANAPTNNDRPPLEHRLAWIFLPALASMMLLAITNHLCQDVAVVPFFWVVPLSLYLVSFIITFDHARWYRRRIFAIATAVVVFFLCLVMLGADVDEKLTQYGVTKVLSWMHLDFKFDDFMSDLVIEAGVYMAVLFLLCMLCHGEVVRCRPSTRYLTSFYLMISAGGALGGLFVALVCPQLFSSFVEMGVGLVAVLMLALGVLADEFWTTWLLNSFWKRGLSFVLSFLILLVVVRAQFETFGGSENFAIRNFYGVLTIDEEEVDDPQFHIRELLNGRILHGSQFQAPDRRTVATTYYNEESGVGVTLRAFSAAQPKRVATVGLGTGTIASYAQDGDFYCFYEINPNVRMLATTQFTYLGDAEARGATVQIELGDARISLERQEPQRYDIIALDAFSGDAIPAHLLTKEAFDEYFRHLQPQGVIAVHVSNRHLELTPVVGGIAEYFQWPLTRIECDADRFVGEAASDWLLVTRNREFLDEPLVAEVAEPLAPEDYEHIPLWTDQFSNLFQIMDKPDWWTRWTRWLSEKKSPSTPLAE